VRFYTSVDGANVDPPRQHRQLRRPRFAPVRHHGNSDFEIGGYAWQPASDPLHGKVYEVEIRDGIDGPSPGAGPAAPVGAVR
jgi:hypothetical protein